MSGKLILDVNRTRTGGHIQVTLSKVGERGVGWGHRLAGPKHRNTDVDELLSEEIDARDAQALREMLDAVFPLQAPSAG